MASTYWEVRGVDAIRRADGVFEFFVSLHGPGGELHLALPPDALLSYSVFQRWHLCSTGAMYKNWGVEGRTPEQADSLWRDLIQGATRYPQMVPGTATLQ